MPLFAHCFTISFKAVNTEPLHKQTLLRMNRRGTGEHWINKLDMPSSLSILIYFVEKYLNYFSKYCGLKLPRDPVLAILGGIKIK